jgi:hypothetical protein
MPTRPKSPFNVDTSLTQENARERGYTFVCDVWPGFVEENTGLIQLLVEGGCTFGCSSGSSGDPAMGLYQRLRNPAMEER